MKIEVVLIPVTNPDAGKAHYVDQVGFIPDHDHRESDSLRFIQLTPFGSAFSICFGEGIVIMEPGKQKGVMMVVEDLRAHWVVLANSGVTISTIHEQPWRDIAYFSDPDGYEWTLRQFPPRP